MRPLRDPRRDSLLSTSDAPEAQAIPPEAVDRTYRDFFSFREMVEGTLRALQAPWVEKLDFSSLKQFKDVFISDGMAKRETDAVWFARCEDRPVLLYFVSWCPGGRETSRFRQRKTLRSF